VASNPPDAAAAPTTHAAANAEQALAIIDKVLETKPHVEGHELSTAAHVLSQLRDGMASRQREAGATPDSRRRLEHVNAVISVVLGVHFPLGSVPWDELEKARDWLAGLAREMAAEG
jgi:hypothetical protein